MNRYPEKAEVGMQKFVLVESECCDAIQARNYIPLLKLGAFISEMHIEPYR